MGLGEIELIERLRRQTGTGDRVLLGIGDDAALTAPQGRTVTTVDAVVEGIHFDRASSDARQIAHKALATALSDLAAMAADPGELYVTLGLPAKTDPDFTLAMADALVELAAGWNAVLAGGDTVGSPTLFLGVTAVGHIPQGEEAVTRGGARPGELVCVTGSLGGAGAGLLMIQGRAAGARLAPGIREALSSRQLTPQPLLEAGRALRGLGVSALIDVSDGLGTDLGHIARTSSVAITVDFDRVPVQEGVAEVASAVDRHLPDLALGAGEDYELALTLAPERFEKVAGALESCGTKLSRIGEVLTGEGVRLTRGGEPLPMPRGFEHRS
jgi:thiamine-monophosphate kinase